MPHSIEEQIERQAALEEEMSANGVARYRKALVNFRTNRDETETKPISYLLQKALEQTSIAVQSFYTASEEKRPQRRATAYPLMKDIEPEIVAFLTAKNALDCVAFQRNLTTAAKQVGRALEDELAFRAFNEQKPYLWRAVTESLVIETAGAKQRQSRLRRAVGRYEVVFTPWDDEQRFHVGMKCLDLLIEATGAFQVTNRTHHRKTIKVFEATPTTMEWVRSAHNHAEIMAPIYLPMVMPPVDWTTPFDGGYLNNAFKRLPMVQRRTNNEAYLEDLSNHEMPMVYNAINAVQRTGWKINKPVLDVIQTIWDGQTGLGGLPSENDEAIPPFPTDQNDKDAIKAWRQAASVAHQLNGKRKSRRILAAKALWVAERFKDEEAIYFPHYCDFRGRIYPRPLFLTPQGADYCKGLLTFSEGVALGDQGAAWLAIHGANLWGFDKVALDSRLRWVEENEEDIIASATNPLDHKWWSDADKPFQFLAFCVEWAGFRQEGTAFVSHLPIALDGSCNGLQNFSMALLDEIGGAAVNLVPSTEPADVYQQVADRVTEKLTAITEIGTEASTEARLDAEMAEQWLQSKLVTRKLCKKPVMTLPYGAKQYGMRDGLAEAIESAREEGLNVPFSREDTFSAAAFIGRLVWDSIREVVVAARAAMDFLQKTAQVASRDGLPIWWVTPAGFPVVQDYKALIGKVLKTKLAGVEVQLTISRSGEKLDKKRQSLGVSPNFVHSLDSAHLMRTVCIAQENDVNSFSMIHDSYGTHAALTPILGAALREAFVDQYKSDVLGDFRASIYEQVSEEQRDDLPPVPPKGTLVPSAVLESEFFFA